MKNIYQHPAKKFQGNHLSKSYDVFEPWYPSADHAATRNHWDADLVVGSSLIFLFSFEFGFPPFAKRGYPFLNIPAFHQRHKIRQEPFNGGLVAFIPGNPG